jgi:hypothetical protein
MTAGSGASSLVASPGASMGVDWESRVDFGRLRADRFAKAQRALESSDLGALVLFGFLVAVVLILVMREVLDPYDDRGYMAVPHGDHTHYVPRDWDRSVPMSSFPVIYPAPDERILPDGRVVRADR